MSTTFRKSYRPLSETEQLLVALIKDQAESIERSLNVNTVKLDERSRALAMTKLEECVMWAVKAVTG